MQVDSSIVAKIVGLVENGGVNAIIGTCLIVGYIKVQRQQKDIEKMGKTCVEHQAALSDGAAHFAEIRTSLSDLKGSVDKLVSLHLNGGKKKKK
jgi:hypothetical protein